MLENSHTVHEDYPGMHILISGFVAAIFVLPVKKAPQTSEFNATDRPCTKKNVKGSFTF